MYAILRKFFRRSRALPGRVYGPLTDAERAAYEAIVFQNTKGW